MEQQSVCVEVLIDGDSKLKIENTTPRSYSVVKLYTSDLFYDPFASNIGSICNVKIQHGQAGKFSYYKKYFGFFS